MTTTRCEELADLIPAYALGALDDASIASNTSAAAVVDSSAGQVSDLQQLRTHIHGCPACQRELAAYRAVASAIALTAPLAAPSSALRQRVLAAAEIQPETTRQSVPTAAGLQPQPARRLASRLSLKSRFLGWWSPRDSFGRLSPALGSLALTFALVLSIQTARLQTKLDQQTRETSALADQVAEKDRLIGLLGPGLIIRDVGDTGPTNAGAPDQLGAYIYLMPDRSTAYLLADGLPALPEGRVYQLWLIRDGTRVSGGTFRPEPGGRGRLAVDAPETLSRYQAIGVTIEPAGGSPGPTTPRVFGGKL